MIAKLLQRFQSWSMGRRWPEGYVIPDYFNDGPYLTRTIFLKTRFFSIYLHHFHIGDHDRHMHNHPWAWAFSFILSGAYKEQRLGKKPTWCRWFNFLTRKDYHRVAELRGSVWTLFCCGPRRQDWGFLVKGEHIPHADYFARVEANKKSIVIENAAGLNDKRWMKL